jgi:hypothetical protein
MAQPDQTSPVERQDHAMEIYRAMGVKLVSRNAAVQLAEAVLIDYFGPDEHARQVPLTVTDNGSTWILTGQGKPDFEDGRPANVLRSAHCTLEISQFDGRILKLHIHHMAAPSDTK